MLYKLINCHVNSDVVNPNATNDPALRDKVQTWFKLNATLVKLYDKFHNKDSIEQQDYQRGAEDVNQRGPEGHAQNLESVRRRHRRSLWRHGCHAVSTVLVHVSLSLR